MPTQGGVADVDLSAVRVVVAVLAVLLVALGVWVTTPSYANHWFAASIGLAVGATEMMGRYRDAPFAPLLSIPGLFYVFVNAGAAALAYYLLGNFRAAPENPAMHVLLAGIGAMAFFRSGLFTVRLGEADVAIGPNLILQILLQALDRAYDRNRATPRSTSIARIMSGISFPQAQTALPALCFNLMQNISDAEKESIGAEVSQLASDPSMGDEAKALILGLALFNVVGDETLQAAVSALGNTVQGFKRVDQTMLLDLARLDPAKVVQSLPVVCNELAMAPIADPDALVAKIKAQAISPESQAVLILYKLIRQFGESTVATALSVMTASAASPPPSPTPAPAPAPVPAPPPGQVGEDTPPGNPD